MRYSFLLTFFILLQFCSFSQSPIASTPKDTFLVNYLKRNIRYPQSELKNNQQKTIYLWLKFGRDGQLEKFEIQDSLKVRSPDQEVVIVGSSNPDNVIKFTDSTNTTTQIFANSIKSAVKKIKISDENLISGKQYFLKIAFRIEQIYDPVLKTVEPM